MKGCPIAFSINIPIPSEVNNECNLPLFSPSLSLTLWMMWSPICCLCGGTEHSPRMRGKSGIRGQGEEEKGVGGWCWGKVCLTLACVQFSVNTEIFWSWSCCCVSGRLDLTSQQMMLCVWLKTGQDWTTVQDPTGPVNSLTQTVIGL